jgi:hypothetical protein
VGIENSRAELEESFDSSGLCEEGPGGSGRAVEGRLPIKITRFNYLINA